QSPGTTPASALSDAAAAATSTSKRSARALPSIRLVASIVPFLYNGRAGDQASYLAGADQRERCRIHVGCGVGAVGVTSANGRRVGHDQSNTPRGGGRAVPAWRR